MPFMIECEKLNFPPWKAQQPERGEATGKTRHGACRSGAIKEMRNE